MNFCLGALRVNSAIVSKDMHENFNMEFQM